MVKKTDEGQIFWNGEDLLLIILITLFVTITFGTILTFVVQNFNLVGESILTYKPILVNFLQFITLIGASSYIVMYKYDLNLEYLGLKITDWKKIIIFGLIGGIVIFIMIILTNLGIQRLVDKWWEVTIPSQSIVTQLINSESLLFFFIYSSLVIIIGPIAEEIFFRGLLYQYLKSRLGLIKGASLAAVIFGLAHLNPWTFLATFLGGLSLIIIYELSESLYTNIIAHITWNLIVVIIIYLLWQNSSI
ncbi:MULTISPECIES: CPBP family intramembrane glutamic endopeptidase [unclassified Candidatus Frackibacter]|uniref:CPBP family intramembrane glutamic endopeptidase n=1 Tax=unclassified Candidatus Frackibacter TaxID=2648818 RepID=UPI00088A2D91|nr:MULTISPECIES: CPBP family intramembrane glutamic endopeptidase [unclassified Candidatus Frackibacter]SDB97789.1 hypothetical protein SAMN04515661_101111 [Candidatus Frackibacter sp. WG11]SEM29481.1 hypothetical protein SAMN04488698_101112 [Candidatus Frackibacter sp. WG12]SFL34382.1 hypothetical protein SAMN04488699_101113 [Candidatus Frackibacter sp. WG13]